MVCELFLNKYFSIIFQKVINIIISYFSCYRDNTTCFQMSKKERYTLFAKMNMRILILTIAITCIDSGFLFHSDQQCIYSSYLRKIKSIGSYSLEGIIIG